MSDAPLPLSRALARALARHIDQSFGLMGNGNAYLIDAFTRERIAYTAVRHETATVAAADAYTRVSGRLAVATTTYGAGFTNTLTALAEATQARTPLLLVVGDAPSDGPRPWDVDQEMLAAALGLRTHTLSVTNIDRTVDRAVSYALRARRPVVIAIPYDLANGPTVPPAPKTEGIDLSDPALLASLSASVAEHAQPKPPERRHVGRTTVHQLEQAVIALEEAERPAILAGHGAFLAEAGPELGALAEALGAVTATTALARGIFPDPRYDLGITGGFGQPRAMETLQEADVVVVAGAGLNQFTMRFGELFGAGTTVIRIDDEQVSAPRTARPITHILLQGDAKTTLTELIDAVVDSGREPSGWREQVDGLEADGERRRRETGDAPVCEDGRLDPRAVAARIGELLPADRHVTSDGGHFIGWANMYWPVASPERMIMVGTAYQTIGLGLPTVAGVAAAAPESTVVLTTGDGGGLMGLADLETAIRTAKSCVIVVWNDAEYGAEVHLYGALGLDRSAMMIPQADFAGLAEALGATGVRVERLEDLAELESWVAAGSTGTILLDCRISPSVVAEYQREVQRVNGVDLEA